MRRWKLILLMLSSTDLINVGLIKTFFSILTGTGNVPIIVCDRNATGICMRAKRSRTTYNARQNTLDWIGFAQLTSEAPG